MSADEIYATNSKVRWFASEGDVNSKLASIIGKKFEEYREKWDAVNRFDIDSGDHGIRSNTTKQSDLFFDLLGK